MVEVWRSISGADGYDVSSEGRVRSRDRKIVTSRGVVKSVKGQVLKPWRGSSGYLQVHLGRGNVHLVHHLVLDAFSGGRPEGWEARHLNGDSEDNRSSNLQWSTHKVNESDKALHGTDWQRNKTHCPHLHPLEEPNLVPSRWRRGYRLCRACNREYYSSRNAGRQFDVSRADSNLAAIMAGH